MSHIKKTLLAITLTGISLAGHAAASLASDGVVAEADVAITQKVQLTNTLTVHPRTSVEVDDGLIIAVGKVAVADGSAQKNTQFEVDLSGSNVRPENFRGQRVIAASLNGNSNSDNTLNIALAGVGTTYDGAVNANSGIVIDNYNQLYHIILLNNDVDALPVDTYTIKTTAYLWSE